MEITMRLMGGLGNQMFQYAAGISLAQKINAKLYLDKSDPSLKTHSYSLEKFNNLNCSFIKTEEYYQNILPNFFNLKSKIYRKTGINLIGNKIYIEKDFSFQKNYFRINKNKYIIGYFQSENYFKENTEIIKNHFKFPTQIDPINISYIDKILSTNSVSIHVRRGDYISNSAANIVHGNCCTLEYYTNAANYINKKVGNIELFIFSDDIEWVKNNFKFNYKSHYVNHNPLDKNIEDLRLMSTCKHNIIANSSFSWWGAYLNLNLSKTVIAPQKWFNTNINTSTLIPESWIKI